MKKYILHMFIIFVLLFNSQNGKSASEDITLDQKIGIVLKTLVDKFIQSSQASLDKLSESEQADLKQIMNILKHVNWTLAFKLYQQHVISHDVPTTYHITPQPSPQLTGFTVPDMPGAADVQRALQRAAEQTELPTGPRDPSIDPILKTIN